MKLWYKTGDVAALRELSRSRVVCLDVETTGFDPYRDEVLQLAFVRGDNEVLLSHFVCPEHHTSWPEAQRIHGITPLLVKDCAPLVSLKSEIEEIFEDAGLIVGYNVAFDLAFLHAAGISCGHSQRFDVMREFAPVVGRWDAMRRRYAWVSLARCAQFYGVSFRAHDALEDARATLACFWAMLEQESCVGHFVPAQSYLDVVARYARAGRRLRGEQDEWTLR